MEKIVVQKIVKSSPNVAGLYFRMISDINGLDLSERDVRLLSFVAMHGNISEKANRELFCKMNDTTTDTINNIVSKLKKMKIVVKEDKVIKLNPVFDFDYSKDVQLQITLKHEQ